MYATQGETNKKLKKQVKKLKVENIQLKNENRELRERVQKLELIVEETTDNDIQEICKKERGERFL